MQSRRFTLIFLSLAFILMMATAGFAQTVISGDLTGTVTDASNAVVANAPVTLTSTDFGSTSSTTTSQAGFFRFSNLRPGKYTVTIKATGFATNTRQAIVSLGKETSVPIQLAVAGSSQTMEVTAESPILESENANLTQNFNSTQIANLPSPGQDLTNYALMAPGIALSTGAGYGNFTANGMPGTSNLYTVNGGDMNDPYNNLNNSGSSNNMLGVNEVQEVTVVTNGYTGQYGRAAGANMTMTTKSGTNQFHGNANWYWNGSSMNANDWFNNNAGSPRGFANSNQYAGSIGGPIKKDKLFFFFDDEGLRYVLFANTLVNLPSTQFEAATLANLAEVNPTQVPFFQQMFNLYDGANGVSRAVPTTAGQDPNLGCGDLAGTPTGLGGTFGVDTPCARSFRGGNTNKNVENLFTIRVDWVANEKNHVSFRYYQDVGDQPTFTDPINPVFNAASHQPQYQGQMTWNQTISNTMVNQVIIGGMYYGALFTLPNFSQALQKFPAPISFFDGLPFNNMGGTMYTYPQGRNVSQAQVIDDFSWGRGNHNLKFGANFRQNNITDFTPFRNTTGRLEVFSMTNLFAGVADRLAIREENTHSAPLQYYSLGLYAQDEWRVKPNLILTLALRADRNSNESCKNNCYSVFPGSFTDVNHSVDTPYNSSILTNQNQAYNSLQTIAWEPRIGVAYTLYPKTVLRGGFGVFSDMFPGQITERFAGNAPYVASFNVDGANFAPGTPGNAFTIAQTSYNALVSGFSNGATLAQLKAATGGVFTAPTFNSANANMYYPMYMKWNFEVEQQLAANTVLSLNYVGNHGYNEILQQPAYNTACSLANCPNGFGGLPLVRTDLRFNSVVQLTNNGYSNYNGAIITLTQRPIRGFSGQISYTWSHSQDVVSNAGLQQYSFIGSGDSFEFQINPFNVRSLNYGSSDYDFRHLVNLSYVWQIPFKSSNKALNILASGWAYSGVLHFRSGEPYSVFDSYPPGSLLSGGASNVVLGTFLGGSIPGCSNPGNPAVSPYQCLNASQFVASGNGTGYGNLARNSFRGPSYFDWDMTFFKTFKISERFTLTAGINAYNILNHPNFGNPDADLNSGTFGQILQTVTPASSPYGNFQEGAASGRLIQTGLKFAF